MHRNARTAVWSTIATAGVFTAFAWVTTQLKGVRVGSPWQDDPYDAVVSFTELLVPALTALMMTRMALWRRAGVRLDSRVGQLTRACIVCLAMVAATVAADWLAVLLRADYPLWNSATPWLVGALALLTVSTVATALLHRRTPLADLGGDWLDDLPAWGLTRMLQRCLRRHFLTYVGAAAIVASLARAVADAVGEGWTNPLLFVTSVTIGVGGLFAAGVLANAVLRVVRPEHPTARPALLAAAVAAGAALPVAAALRDPIWALLGRHGDVDSPAKFAAITFGAGLLVGALALAASALGRRRAARRTSP